MKALITAQEYFDKNIFEKENQQLFSKVWNFVGFKNEFVNINDFSFD